MVEVTSLLICIATLGFGFRISKESMFLPKVYLAIIALGFGFKFLSNWIAFPDPLDLIFWRIGLYVCIPMLYFDLAAKAAGYNWERGIWGRLFIALCAGFELARRSNFLDDYLFGLVIAQALSVGFLMIKWKLWRAFLPYNENQQVTKDEELNTGLKGILIFSILIAMLSPLQIIIESNSINIATLPMLFITMIAMQLLVSRHLLRNYHE